MDFSVFRVPGGGSGSGDFGWELSKFLDSLMLDLDFVVCYVQYGGSLWMDLV